jgi:hypothetical protein
MACSNTVTWLYKLDKDYTYQTSHTWPQDMEFLDGKGIPRMRMSKDGLITVLKEYCWDGCTPKYCVMDMLLGTPEGAVHQDTGLPKTWDASLVHDALCQFKKSGVPLSQREIDLIMLDLLQMRQFSLSRVYYFFVRVFGWITQPLTYRIRDYSNNQGRVIDDDGADKDRQQGKGQTE